MSSKNIRIEALREAIRVLEREIQTIESDANLAIPLEDLQLSVRSSNVLTRCGVKTLGDIVALDLRQCEAEDGPWRGFGRTSRREVERMLRDRGLL